MDFSPSRALLQISRRSLLRGLALGCGGGVAAASLGACSDEPAAGAAPDAGPDGAAGGAPDAAGHDAGTEAGGDVAVDAGTAADAEADVSPEADAAPEADAGSVADAGPEAGPDVHRPGILSVPADDPDVTAKTLTLGAGLRGYLAVPNRPGTFAGLVLIHEDGALTEHVEDLARRFAKTGGCVALAPDLGGRPAQSVLADLNAALDALAAQTQVGANRLGAAGFGAGGSQSLRFAAANPRVRAVVSYYAPVPTPADELLTINAAVLGQYGLFDLPINAGIPELERVLKEAGKTFEKRFYPASHAFNDDTAPTYDEPAAVSAWSPTIQWFEMYLG